MLLKEKTNKFLFFILLFILNFYNRDILSVSTSLKNLGFRKYFTQGLYNYNNKNYNKSIFMFLEALRIYDNYHVRDWLARSYYKSGYIKNSLNEWNNLLNLNKDDYSLRNKVNRILYNYIPSVKSHEDRGFKYIYSALLNNVHLRSLAMPISMFFDSKKNQFAIANYNSSYVSILDFYGNLYKVIDIGQGGRPYDISVYQNKYYITDYGTNKVHVFDSNYNLIKQFGHKGDDKLAGPQGIDIQHDSIYVVDNSLNRVVMYSINYQKTLVFGNDNNYSLYLPSDIIVSSDYVYVSDTGNKVIAVFKKDGSFVKTIGKNFFIEPKGIKLLDHNTLLVADSKLGVIKVNLEFDNLNDIIIKLDSDMPHVSDIAINNNSFIYTTDIINNNIKVFIPESFKMTNINISVDRNLFFYKNSNSMNFLSSILNKAVSSSWFWEDKVYSQDDLNTIPSIGVVPYIMHTVLIKDPLGRPIGGLNNYNFKLEDNGVEYSNNSIKLIPSNEVKKSLNLILVNSFSKKHYGRYIEILTELLNTKLDPEDSVTNINVDNGNNYKTTHLYSHQRAGIINYMSEIYSNSSNNYLFKDVENVSLDNVLYHSISNAYAKIDQQGAIVLFVSDDVLNSTVFNSKTYIVCANYAKNNNIPIYVVNFSDKLHPGIKHIYKETQGKYYQAYKSNSISYIYNTIKSFISGEYFVSYDLNLNSMNYIDDLVPIRFSLSVDIYGLSGTDNSLYYIYNINK